MKYKLVLIILFICFILPNQSYFKIEGMVCEGGCSYKIKSIVNAIDGVKESDIDFENKILSVDYNPKQVNEQLIIDKISEGQIFKATKIKIKKEKNRQSWFKNWFY